MKWIKNAFIVSILGSMFVHLFLVMGGYQVLSGKSKKIPPPPPAIKLEVVKLKPALPPVEKKETPKPKIRPIKTPKPIRPLKLPKPVKAKVHVKKSKARPQTLKKSPLEPVKSAPVPTVKQQMVKADVKVNKAKVPFPRQTPKPPVKTPSVSTRAPMMMASIQNHSITSKAIPRKRGALTLPSSSKGSGKAPMVVSQASNFSTGSKAMLKRSVPNTPSEGVRSAKAQMMVSQVQNFYPGRQTAVKRSFPKTSFGSTGTSKTRMSVSAVQNHSATSTDVSPRRAPVSSQLTSPVVSKAQIKNSGVQNLLVASKAPSFKHSFKAPQKMPEIAKAPIKVSKVKKHRLRSGQRKESSKLNSGVNNSKRAQMTEEVAQVASLVKKPRRLKPVETDAIKNPETKAFVRQEVKKMEVVAKARKVNFEQFETTAGVKASYFAGVNSPRHFAVKQPRVLTANFDLPKSPLIDGSAHVSSPVQKMARLERKSRPVPRVTDPNILKGYLAKVMTKIEKEKGYPEVARKKKWEGRVTVDFVIRRDGGVRDLRLKAPCHHELLNREALAAVQRAAPFGGFPEGIGKSFLKVELPFNFQLTN